MAERFRRRVPTNSVIVGVVCAALVVLAGFVSGVPGMTWYVVGFLTGGVGTAINAARAMQAIRDRRL